MRAHLGKRRLWLVSALGALTVAAVTATASAGATAAGNLARAHSEAPRLLALLRLPSGATASTGEPSGDHGVLAMPGYDEVNPNLVDAHAFWTVPGKAADVLGYVVSHLPAGARPYTSGGGNVAPGYAMKSFTLTPIAAVLRERVIAVTVVQLKPDTTGVRTDGEAVWLVPRPGWEQIPRGVRKVLFTVRGRQIPARLRPFETPHALVGVSARRLTTFVNRLALVQPGGRFCPAGFFLSLHFRFVAAGGRTMAQAVEYPTGCPYVNLSIAGRRGPRLSDLPTVMSELSRLGALPPGVAPGS